MTYLFIKTGSLKQATYRIRLLPWLQLGLYGHTIIRWNSYTQLLYLLFCSLLQGHKCLVLTNKSFYPSFVLLAILFKPFNVYFGQDIADFYYYTKATIPLTLFSRLFRHFSILFSDVIFTPTSELKNLILSRYPSSLIYIVPDSLDIEFLPQSCSTPYEISTKSYLNIGWFGTSGKFNDIKGISSPSDSFKLLLDLIPDLLEADQLNRLYLLTDNLKYIIRNPVIQKGVKDNRIILSEYSQSNQSIFFDKIDLTLITYGNTTANSTKSTNRPELSMWLGKLTLIYQPPQSWYSTSEPVLDYSIVLNTPSELFNILDNIQTTPNFVLDSITFSNHYINEFLLHKASMNLSLRHTIALTIQDI